MIELKQIKANTTVVCSNNLHFAVVDYVEGLDQIKLAKDAHGKHHYIPLNWVKVVDDKIHLDRTSAAAMRDWTDEPVVATVESVAAQKGASAQSFSGATDIAPFVEAPVAPFLEDPSMAADDEPTIPRGI